MGPTAEFVAEQVAADVIAEAIDEVTGGSNRKWALVLIALVVGAVVASMVLKHRREQPAAEGDDA